jgi:hypothetical protein
MQVPGGLGGPGFATIKSKNGVVTATYTLSDDDKHPIVFAMMGSRSGAVPQWIPNTHSGGLLFGSLTVADGLTSLSAPALTWMRPAGNGVYPALLPTGFTNSPFAGICSPFNPANQLSGNYLLTISGVDLAVGVTNLPVVFSGNKMTANGIVKAGSMDANGKLKFTFLDGISKTHATTALGTMLQNTPEGVGFFIKSGATDAGNVILTPQ